MKEHKENATLAADQWRAVTCVQENEISEGTLVGCGNPLVDLIMFAPENLFRKYRLKRPMFEFATPQHQELFDDVKCGEGMKQVAAGNIHNIMRVFQWILHKPLASAYLGCVGNDNQARFLIEKARLEGINARYQFTDAARTGRCAILLSHFEDSRAIISDPQAAKFISLEHMRKYSNRKLLERAKFFYTSTYFINSSMECAMELAKLAHQLSRPLIFKLGPRVMVEMCADDLKVILPYVDVLFCSELGLRRLGAIFGWESKIMVLGRKAFQLPKKNPQRQRLIVIMRSEMAVLVVQEDSIREFPVPALTPLKFNDTSGTVDAFIGAFLSQYVQGKEISVCVMWGIWAGKTIIQNLGCTFEGAPMISKFWLKHYTANASGAGVRLHT